MKLYIQESQNLVKFNLPQTVDGSLLFSYKSTETGIENTINIDSKDNFWVLKSNGNINIINSKANDSIIEQLLLQEYMFITISVIGKEQNQCLFCLPSIEKSAMAYNVET